MSSGSPASGLSAAAWLPLRAKASFTSPMERCSRRTEPSPSRLSQSRTSPGPGASVGAACAGGGAAPGGGSAEARRPRSSFTVERTTLSAMTSTVTVAPLTMSTCGGRCSPRRHRPHGGTDQMVERPDDPLLGDADQHDRLVVLHQLDAADDALGIGGDQDRDGFAAIAGRVRHVGVQPDMADEPLPGIDGGDRRIPLRRPDPVGAGEDLARLNLGQELGQPRGGNGENHEAEQETDQGQDQRQRDAVSETGGAVSNRNSLRGGEVQIPMTG